MLTLTVLPYGPLYSIGLIGLKSRENMHVPPTSGIISDWQKKQAPSIETLNDRWNKRAPPTAAFCDMYGKQRSHSSYLTDDSVENFQFRRDYTNEHDSDATMVKQCVGTEPEADRGRRGRFLNDTIPTTDHNVENSVADMENHELKSTVQPVETLSDWLKLHNNRADDGKKPSSPNPS